MLPSGLRLIVEPARDTGQVAVVLVIGAGLVADPPGREGMAHLVEHLALKLPREARGGPRGGGEQALPSC